MLNEFFTKWTGIATFIVDPGLLTSDSDGELRDLFRDEDLMADLLVVMDMDKMMEVILQPAFVAHLRFLQARASPVLPRQCQCNRLHLWMTNMNKFQSFFFPSNAFMALARSLLAFNRSKKMNCKLSCNAV